MALPRFQDSSNRPMMLKDFLRDDYYQYSSTRKFLPCNKSTASSKSNKQPPAIVLLRSWSKKAAATKVSAIQKVIKFLAFASVKSPLTVLPRSNSRKLAKDKDILGDVMSEGGKVKVKVQVKDILRWRSFRDVAEEESTPLDIPLSPNRTTTTSSWSKRSNWWCDCDSDFTADELPLWGGENEELFIKQCFLGANATLLRNSKEDWSMEEYEQKSPVSILDSPFREYISPFHPTYVNFERARCMLTRRNQESDDILKSKHTRKDSFGGETSISEGVNATEEKAKELLSHVKEDSQSLQQTNDHLILDFFLHELSINGKFHDVEFHNEISRFAKSWANGEYDGKSDEWEVEDDREVYVKDLEKGVSWNKFEQEQEEISIEFEVKVLDELIDQLLVDFFLTK